MDFFTNLSAKQQKMFKIGGILVLGAIVVMGLSSNSSSSPFAQMKNVASEYGYATDGDYYSEPMISDRGMGGGIMPPTDPSYTPGDNTDDYEVKQYSISFESRDKSKECVAVRDLLDREDVVFENTNEYDSGCSYNFKVKKESVEAVLAILDALNPKDVNENTYTIKREVTDYTSEIEILEQKLESLKTTLAESLTTYDQLIARASAQGDISSLTQLTDSKLSLIERLTMSQIETSAQLERINRSKAEALDRLAYTQFNVSVYENKLIDGKEMGNSWTAAVQELFRDINNFAQEITLGFVALLFMVVKYALYGVVLLFALRFGYSFAKKVWQNGANK